MYGYPSSEARTAARRGEVTLGGCVPPHRVSLEAALDRLIGEDREGWERNPHKGYYYRGRFRVRLGFTSNPEPYIAARYTDSGIETVARFGTAQEAIDWVETQEPGRA